MKLVFLLLLVFCLCKNLAVANETTATTESQIKVLVTLREKFNFFSEINKSYISTVNDCMGKYNFITANSRDQSIDPICMTHFKYLATTVKNDLAEIRFYLALMTLQTDFARELGGKNFFSNTHLASLVPNIGHFSFSTVKWISSLAIPELDPLSPDETSRVIDVLKHHISLECKNLVRSEEASYLFDIISDPLLGSDSRKYFCNLYVNYPESQQTVLDKLQPSAQSNWLIARNLLIENVSLKVFSKIKTDAGEVYHQLIGRHPFLVLVRGFQTYRIDIKEAFRTVSDNMERSRSKTRQEDLETDKLIMRWKSHKTTWAQTIDLKNRLEIFLDSDFLVAAEIMNYKFQKDFVSKSALEKLSETHKFNKDFHNKIELGGLLAANGLCFLPLGRLVGAAKLAAAKIANVTNKFSIKNMCLFAMNQPLSILFAVNNYRQMELIYNTFLTNTKGDDIGVEFANVDSSIKSLVYSLFFIPVGTKQTISSLKSLALR